MASRYDISFCIPTYNFGAYIGETLDSLIAQADDRIQIVIVDGGSTDNTAQVVAEKSRQFPHIKFIQRQERSGVDRDILESVAQAEGEYCWLFSSDDCIAPGAVEFLRGQLGHDWNVFLTDYAVCDLHLNRLNGRAMIPVNDTTSFDWNVPAERSRYFELAQSPTAFFSFISAVVVKRDDWMRASPQVEFVGSCWIIAAQLFGMARERLVVRYHPGELVLNRGENDSFLARGLVNRFSLSIDGFRKVAEHYFGINSPESRHVSRAVKNEVPPPALIHCRLRIEDPADRKRLDALVCRQYSDGSFSDFVRRRFILAPDWLLLSVRSALRLFKSLRRPVSSLERSTASL
ncbi:MAG: glycosyltransferase family 2 protein [Planctomycetota bacterium]|nr:glycosyltransferase family 2 protein [Planctomycetota bacterium]